MFTITFILEIVLKGVKGYKPVSVFLTSTLSIGKHPTNLLNQTTSISKYRLHNALVVWRATRFRYAICIQINYFSPSPHYYVIVAIIRTKDQKWGFNGLRSSFEIQGLCKAILAVVRMINNVDK